MFDELDPFNVNVDTSNVNTIETDEGVIVKSTSAAFPIAAQLREKQDALAKLEAENAANKARLESLKSQRAEMQKAIDEISRSIGELDLALYDYRRDHRILINEITALKTQLNQAIFNEQRNKELVKNKLDFDKRLASFAYGDKIMQHQKDGAFILATNMKCILGDKMGSGKTLSVIAAWDMAQSQRILAVVPDDVVQNFVREINHWAPHRDVLQIGKLDKISREFVFMTAKKLEAFVMVINYSAWRKDKTILDSLIDLRFDTVVLDEAHEIKNTSTSAYKGVSQVILAQNACPRDSGAVVKVPTEDDWGHYYKCTTCQWDSNTDSDYQFFDRCSVKMVIPMTGTVMLNKPQDLFALLSLVDPVNFTRERRFLDAYCQQNLYTNKWEFRSGGLASLQKKLSGHYIAREGVKTPGQIVYNHDLEIDPDRYPEQFKVIEQLSKHAQIIMDSGKKLNILYTISLILRKRQANVWPAGIQLKDEHDNVVFSVGDEVQESIKLDKCIQFEDGEWTGLIPEITEGGDKVLGDRVFVVSQFKGPLKELERRLSEAEISCVRFDGDTPETLREQVRMDFDRKHVDNENGEYKWQVLLANYRTGGVGLNFTGATHLIELDSEWNPGKRDQAYARIDRIGQVEKTKVHRLRLVNTIDTWMDALIEEKENLVNGFNDATESLSTQLLDAMRNGEMM